MLLKPIELFYVQNRFQNGIMRGQSNRGENSMKKVKRLLAVVLAACMLMVSAAIPASAASSHSYYFSFPGQLSGSLRSTPLYARTSGTASVTPSVTTVKTMYILSPTQYSSTQATNAVYKTYAGTSNFSWFSGYGGTGNTYCLSGCPSMDLGSFNAYVANGTFAM